MEKIKLLVLATILCFVGCSKNGDDEPKESINVSVTSNQTNVFNGMELTFTASVLGGDVKETTFYFDGQSIGSSITPPFNLKHKLKDVEPGNHKISCVVKSIKGNDFTGETSISVTLRLGDEYKGGKVFKLNSDGESGLIGSTEDLSYNGDQGAEVRFYWGMDGVTVGTGNDNGKANTTLMAAKATSPSFAGYHFKNGYNRNGFTDWYIPSIDELEILKENKSYVGNFSNLTDWNAMYWSSSEQSESKAFILNFNALMGNTNEKSRVFKIRPIRQF